MREGWREGWREGSEGGVEGGRRREGKGQRCWNGQKEHEKECHNPNSISLLPTDSHT